MATVFVFRKAKSFRALHKPSVRPDRSEQRLRSNYVRFLELKELKHIVEKLQSTIDNLSKSSKGETPTVKAPSTTPKKVEAEDEIDLFGSDDEEEVELFFIWILCNVM